MTGDVGQVEFSAPEVTVNAQGGFAAAREEVPEDLRRPYTHKLDIWALGCLLCILLSGSKLSPFAGSGPDEVRQRIIKRNMQFPHTLAHLERDLVERCLAEQPADRPSAEGVLDHPVVRKHVAQEER